MKKLQRVNLFSLLILTISLACAAQERFVLPVDEGKSDASLNTFRAKLIEATRSKNADFVLNIVDKDIKNSFGGDDGKENFKKIWALEKKDSAFWEEFLTVLTNGGAFYKDEGSPKTFCAPYSFMVFPDDLDAFEYSLVFGENINLRSQPNLFAPIVTQLSYNVIKVDYQSSADDGKNENSFVWMKVTTLGGKTGFIAARYVRSPIGYRACFQKMAGSWKMTAFIAGD
ncbi:MAG: SH3 domain-containing protein [Pyrinomonadaceae bacterium]